jgi:hypothetical protein
MNELVGELEQHPRPVAGLGIGEGGAAMRQAGEHLDPAVDELVGLAAVDLAHEPDTARSVLEARIVETLARGYVLM